MGFFIDDIAERLQAGAVEVKKNGNAGDFLVTSKTFHSLSGKELDDEFAVLSAGSVENDKKQVENQIMNLEENKKNMLLQIEQIEQEIAARQNLLPHYAYFIDYLKDFDKPKKEKK